MHNIDKISWTEINDLHLKVVLDIYKSKWIPDYIVGIVRGGAIPGIMISHTMDIPFIPLDIRLRDKVCNNDKNWNHFASNVDTSKKYLFVDDINDVGDTFKLILEKWYKDLNVSFNDTNKICTLYERSSSKIESDYVGKLYYEEDWLLFPWENEYAN